MKKLIIIDGNSLLFRAYYATLTDGKVTMRTKDGTPTNAIFAFANMFTSLLKTFAGGEHVLVAFDTEEKTFRHQVHEEYKATRKPAPDDLIPQFAIAREFLQAMGIFQYEEPGFEADDIAGTAAKKAATLGYQVEIYTSDKDYLQLIDEQITIKLIKGTLRKIETMNEKNMLKTYGFTPKQIVDYKGLCGDSSDNLKGIPGIGDITAKKLLAEYHTFEGVLAAAPNMTGKIRENILNHADEGRLSYEMAKIVTDMELPFSIEETKYLGYHPDTLLDFTHHYELRQFRERLEGRFARKTLKESPSDNINIVEDENDIVFDNHLGVIGVFEEGNYHTSKLEGLALFTQNKRYYLPWDVFVKSPAIQNALANPQIKKYTFDYKKLRVNLGMQGYLLQGLKHDILLASYNVESSNLSDPLSVYHLFGVNLPLVSAKKDEITLAMAMAENALLLTDELERRLKEVDVFKIYRDIELPLAEVLAKMEIEGFPLDRKLLLEIGEDFKIQLAALEKEIHSLVGREFNIASPKQVGEVLFDQLGLPANKKRSTSSDILEGLRLYHPVVDLILQHRKYAKLASTYIDGLKDAVYPDGKIHATFNQALTTTGRLSSSEPNLQNISVRDEEGRLIRKAFYYADDNYQILSLDYSQIELRILAALSGDPKLIEVFKTGQDIHTATAKAILHKQHIDEHDRRRAKEVNFGIVYGITVWGLSDRLGIPQKTAKELIENFYKTYPKVQDFLNRVISEAEEKGYVETLLGRRRYLREFKDPNYHVRAFARRAAMNAPIQGTAADLIKLAMVKIDQYLTANNLTTKLVVQIHDELIFKVPKAEKDIVLPALIAIMEHALELDVPLKVSGNFGKTWYDA
ncbi:MAG: DNA polymerase I [Bacilli bacterium]